MLGSALYPAAELSPECFNVYTSRVLLETLPGLCFDSYIILQLPFRISDWTLCFYFADFGIRLPSSGMQ